MLTRHLMILHLWGSQHIVPSLTKEYMKQIVELLQHPHPDKNIHTCMSDLRDMKNELDTFLVIHPPGHAGYRLHKVMLETHEKLTPKAVH
eukprot:50967-Eustigmatos_ZCMA.PRE.1